MENIDLAYLCSTVGNLCGIPVRVYQDDQQVFLYDPVHLVKDPLLLYQKAIWKIDAHVGYFVTTHFHYYGIVNVGNIRIIIGPARQITGDDQELRELAFRLDIPAVDTDDFVRSIKAIVPMPLESILQVLCTVNYVLSGEKLTLQDVAIVDSQQTVITQEFAGSERELTQDHAIPHSTYELEQAVLHMVRKGDSASLRKWAKSAPAVRGGLLAAEQLRQLKNTFIVTTTLVSRSAIRGGMDVDTAFALSDSYIQKCELMHTLEQIINLQFHMIMDYTAKVERIRLGTKPTKLSIDVANYVQKHLSEAISTQAMADALFISRPHLSKRFREETGQTLTDFILNEKTEEAKRLLRHTEKTISVISDYLGFSSLGHFSRVFRKYVGLSPSEYRDKYTK